MAVRPDPVVEQTLDRVGTLCAQRHALDIELCEQLAVLADAGNPQAAGFRSVAQWLSLAGGLSPAEAKRYVRVSAELASLGELVSDARSGRVGIVALDSVANVITTDNADKLTCLTRTLGVAGLAKALGLYRRYRETPVYLENELSSWSEFVDERGWYHLRARLRGATGELLRGALVRCREGATDLDDAVSHLASASLEHNGPGVSQVLIHAELNDIADLLAPDASHVRLGSATYDRDGRRVEPEELASVIDDAKVAVIVSHEGKPLWLSNSLRTATIHQHKALRVRSGGRCEVPGCDATRFLRAHHVVFHSVGGPTELENLFLVCGFHHRQIHHHRWSVKHLGNQEFEVFNQHHESLGTTRDPNDQRLPGDPTLPLPPPHFNRRTPRAQCAGERLTYEALDVFIAGLLEADAAGRVKRAA